MKIGIPKEIASGERRVAGTADTVKRLIEQGFSVFVESGAGEGARCSDEEYKEAGATVVLDANPIWDDVDIVLKVRPPMLDEEGGFHEGDRLRKGVLLVCLVYPAQNKGLLARMGAHGGSVLALDQIPRISQAQKMDVLSSMATIAGYRAIIEASHLYEGFFGGQITAAGRIQPAQVLIIGAGAAGLAAIATARGLGAEVRVFDVRPALKEQVENLGARFLTLEFAEEQRGESSSAYAKVMSKAFIAAEKALFRQQAREVDVIVTTAFIPGEKVPILITKDMVESMKSGSVVVDLAAGQGGHCEYSEPDQVVEIGGVSVVGYTDLPSRMARPASQFFGSHLAHLLEDLGKASDFKLDLKAQVVKKALVLHEGELIWPPPPDPSPKAKSNPPAPQRVAVPAATAPKDVVKSSGVLPKLLLLLLISALASLGLYVSIFGW
jgi:NAD(P) transhydrogenase subunit alpha